jgi:hypothetical protein
VIEQDEVHGDGDGHVLMMIKLNLKKRKRKRKTKTKTEMIKAKVYDRFLFYTQDTIEGVSDLGSIAVL